MLVTTITINYTVAILTRQSILVHRDSLRISFFLGRGEMEMPAEKRERRESPRPLLRKVALASPGGV
jgi:hypothetical protein